MSQTREILIGEDIIDESRFFCGDGAEIRCKVCGFLMGKVPVELMGTEWRAHTLSEIGPVIDMHMLKEHGIENGGR
jgi:hypothetical protein